MNKLAIFILAISLTVVAAGPGGWGGWFGNKDNGVGGNRDDPCSQQAVVFIETPNIAATDIEDCRQQCEDDDDCQFFVFNTLAASGSENCGLRDFQPSNLITVNGQRSGFGNLAIANDNVVLVGFALETATAEECQASCEANRRRCRTWSWTNADGNNPLLCVHNYGIADTALDVSDTVTSGRKFCDL